MVDRRLPAIAARHPRRQTSTPNGSAPSATAAISRLSQRAIVSSSGGDTVAGSGVPGGGINEVVGTATPTPKGTLPRVTWPSTAERTRQIAV